MSKKRIFMAAVLLSAIAGCVWLVWPESSSPSNSDHNTNSSESHSTSDSKHRTKDHHELQPASVSGMVLDDNGKSIPGALVLSSYVDASSVFQLESPLPETVIADEEGRWRFASLRPGKLRITASAKGYIPEEPAELSVSSGEDRTDVNITLKLGGHTLSGTVSDMGGGPIVSATLIAKRRSGFGSEQYSLAVSDAEGQYQMQLPPGGYEVEATHEGYVKKNESLSIASEQSLNFSLLPAALVYGKVLTPDGEPVPGAKVYAAGGIGQSKRDGVSVPGVATADEKGEFILRGLPSGGYSLRAVAKGYSTTEPVEIELGIAEALTDVEVIVNEAHSVSGHIVEEENKDKGIGGASIVAINMRSQTFVSAFQVSDEDGYFELHGVLPGTYMIMVNHDERLGSFMDTNVTMVDKDIDDVIVALKTAAVVRGRVSPPIVATIGLRVEEAGFLNMKAAVMAQSANAMSDEEGNFELKMAPQGEFLLTAKTEDGRSGETKISISKSSQEGVVVTLIEGQSLSGTVVDQEGKPVTAVRVQIKPKEPGNRMMIQMGGRNRGGFPVNTKGEYVIRGLVEGEYVVSVLDSRGILPWADDENKPKEIEIGGKDIKNETLKVQRSDGVIVGTVMGVDGAPIVDAWVSAKRGRPEMIAMIESADAPPKPASASHKDAAASDEANAKTPAEDEFNLYEWGEKEEPVLTDESGRFSLRNLRSGQYQVIANAPSGGAKAKRKDVRVGDDIELHLALLRNLRVIVQGAAVSNFTARLSGPMDRSHEVSGASEYVFTRLEAGTYTVSVFTDTSNGEAQVEIGQVAETRVTVELKEYCGITGRVVDLRSKDPVPDLMIMIPGGTADSEMEVGMNLFSGKGPKTDSLGKFSMPKLGCTTGVVVFLDPSTMASGSAGASKEYELTSGTEDLGTIYRLLKPVVSPDNKGEFGLTASYDDETQMAVVRSVMKGSAAEIAGISVGDSISSILSVEVEKLGAHLLYQLLGDAVSIGDVLTLEIQSSSGEAKTLRLEALAKAPQ